MRIICATLRETQDIFSCTHWIRWSDRGITEAGESWRG